MKINPELHTVILVVGDVEETRCGIDRLLSADGYTVNTAAAEEEAIFKNLFHAPDLILLSMALDVMELVAMAKRLRGRSGLPEYVPVVIFCVSGLLEGAEVDVGDRVYLTRPDNFDQLRAFLTELLQRLPRER
jgi:CheY-like chemotaxis protein